MMSSGEDQWRHWVRGVRERPWTFGGGLVVDEGEEGMVLVGYVMEVLGR